MTALLIILMAYLDRLRGTGNRLVVGDARVLAGWCLAALLGHPGDALTLGLVLAYAVGEAPGWGTPLGQFLYGVQAPARGYEWWQLGSLKTSPGAALAVRGVMWGAPFVPLAYFDRSLGLVPVLFAVAMPLAVVIARVSNRWQYEWLEGDLWARQEYARGILIGIMAAGISYA